MTQHEMALNLALSERLDNKVMGLLVAWKGHTLTVTHSSDAGWQADGFAAVEDEEVHCYAADQASAESAMDAVIREIEDLEK